VVRQLVMAGDLVVLGSRDLAAGERAAEEIVVRAGIGGGGEVWVRRLDVDDPRSLAALAEELAEQVRRVDVLVNNAAIHYDTHQSAVEADLGIVREALETNLLGAWRCVQAFLPLLRRSAHGRIVNVSSEGGSLAGMGGGVPAYRVSKVGLNALTRMLADELRHERILVNSVCPGWVATDMGGPGGRPVAEGAAGVVWAADLPDDGPTGGFFRDGRPLPF
jgi:NAD(P)-dependent dehydrogenase (short-subunit alcohol dehydrogenase family)